MKNYIPTKKLTILSFIFFAINATALTVFGKTLARYSNLSKLDFQFKGYNIAFVTKLFTDYGVEGRNTYFWLNILDIVFPFFVALLGFCYFGYSWKKWNYKIVWFVLIIASFSFCLFDTIENIFVFRMLAKFPNFSEIEVMISSISTQIKLISLLIIYIAIPITFLISIIKQLSDKKNKIGT